MELCQPIPSTVPFLSPVVPLSSAILLSDFLSFQFHVCISLVNSSSQTYLGRNRPMSKVWCAAHLQHHHLKKSDCAAVNILKTVDHIMYPDVLIVLRMLSHLLLGVRMYSKQVKVQLEGVISILSDSMRIGMGHLVQTQTNQFSKKICNYSGVDSPVQAQVDPNGGTHQWRDSIAVSFIAPSRRRQHILWRSC